MHSKLKKRKGPKKREFDIFNIMYTPSRRYLDRCDSFEGLLKTFPDLRMAECLKRPVVGPSTSFSDQN